MCVYYSGSHADAVACFPLLLAGHLLSEVQDNIGRALGCRISVHINAGLWHSERVCWEVHKGFMWAILSKYKIESYYLGMN